MTSLPPWPEIIHRCAPTNPALWLCQEWTMRTGGYDDRAIVLVIGREPRSVPFAELVTEYGLDAAIREVDHCSWLAPCEWPGRPSGPCVECEEAAHA